VTLNGERLELCFNLGSSPLSQLLTASTRDRPKTVNMPEIESPDPDELGGNVTKPFKFVTGKKELNAQDILRICFDLPIAGYDARFPNMNQSVPTHRCHGHIWP
jgi:hypothetical protein